MTQGLDGFNNFDRVGELNIKGGPDVRAVCVHLTVSIYVAISMSLTVARCLTFSRCSTVLKCSTVSKCSTWMTSFS